MKGVNDPHRSTTEVDDENGDQLGADTPRSGVATPQPDLHDKRLPGIATSFGQVGTASLKRRVSESGLCGALDSLSTTDASGTGHSSRASERESRDPGAASGSADPSPRNCVSQESRAPEQSQGASEPVPLPTPPESGRTSASPPDRGKPTESEGSKVSLPPARPFLVRHAPSDIGPPAPTLPVSNAAPMTSVVTASAVTPSYPTRSDHNVTNSTSNAHPSDTNPSDHSHSTIYPTLQSLTQAPPPTPPNSRASSALSSLKGWFSFDSVKVLTKAFKSGPSTPTRALSAAQPSQTGSNGSGSRSGRGSGEVSRSETPRPSSGSQTPAAKGKLTIKITEARGIKKSRDPYVVVVFQRNELISGGPRPEDDGEDTPPLPAFNGGAGGVAIQRQGSDSGRTPMAIPMRSRQSSNTSMSEHSTFSRTRSGRKSVSNPKWDAEAAL